jgi:hypothetical protein
MARNGHVDITKSATLCARGTESGIRWAYKRKWASPGESAMEAYTGWFVNGPESNEGRAGVVPRLQPARPSWPNDAWPKKNREREPASV